jgi:hypothetical protein
LTNGHAESFAAGEALQTAPPNSSLGEGGNAAAEAQWDATNDLSSSQEGWVNVSKDAAQPDTGITATPAVPSNGQSWADDQPDSPAVEVRNSFIFIAKHAALDFRDLLFIMAKLIVLQLFVKPLVWISTNQNPLQATPAPGNNDGFHEVQRNKGANRGDGHGHRGHNDRGGRGRGGNRGDGRGRGRGGASRGNGAPRSDGDSRRRGKLLILATQDMPV